MTDKIRVIVKVDVSDRNAWAYCDDPRVEITKVYVNYDADLEEDFLEVTGGFEANGLSSLFDEEVWLADPDTQPERIASLRKAVDELREEGFDLGLTHLIEEEPASE